MNKKNILLAVLGLLCSLQHAIAQGLSNKGREFWVGYGHHQFMEAGQNNSQEMVLYLSAEQAANVTVTIDGTTYVRNYVVPANSVIATEYIPKSGTNDARLISLPCTFVPPGFPCGGEGVFANKGIRIVSDVPIVAYAHIFGSASSGATMLMPIETWGFSYVTLNSKQNYSGTVGTFSWVYAIAKEDNTVIEVTPTALTRAGRPANTSFTVTLMRGQIYQTMAGPEGGGPKPDLSGTTIRSIANPAGNCYPIAVFAGSSRTTNPFACGSGGGDNDNQQCFPSQAWGKRYLTAPTSNSSNPSVLMTNAYKIAVKDPGTIVTKNGVTLSPLANGTYYYESNQADFIESNKPIMVAQFMTGGSVCMGGGVGDPEMMYISPIEQGIKRIGFYRNTRESITTNYLTLIIPTAGVTSLLIDGSPAFNHSYPHPQLPGYTVVVKRWSPANQAQAIAQSDSAFTAITYGLGSVESYGYNAGTLINNLNAVGSIFNINDTTPGTTSHPYTCTNTPLTISVLLGYATAPSKLVWQLSQVPGLSPNTDITDNSPTPVGAPVIINGIPYLKFTAPGTYTFSGSGTFTIPILATHPSIDNCNNTERVSYDLLVQFRPPTDFTLSPTYTGCIADSVRFNGPTSTATFTIEQWLWTFPGGVTSTLQNPVHLFNTTGPQNVALSVVTEEGCVSDSVRTVDIYPRPVTSITATPASLCQDGTVTFTETTTFGGTAALTNQYWNFGPSTATTAGPHTITYPNPGTYTVQHAAGVSATCVSDTAVRVVQVYAKPTTTFTYPAGCLPPSGTVQFTSTASTSDGQAITAYAWTFGDPGSPNNTSTLPNPTHTYSTFGTYPITFSVTTANGCTKDTTVNATFNLSPTFSYTALAPVCQSASGTVSVATASVTNGVPGTGVYHATAPTPAAAVTPAGLFNPSVAGPGTHTIWYVYSATSGCIDSVSQTITVTANPDAAFTIPGAACLPSDGAVTFNYSGTPQTGQTYSWNFGDPGSGANNTSTQQNPSHNFAPGTYTIILNVTNTSGCIDADTIVQTFNLTPALNYPALTTVCESVTGTVSVATATVTNGVTGTGVYSGTGTDAAGNFNPSVAGAGTHTITYTFTGTGNCVTTTTQTIVVNPKPTASFAYPTAACLPSSGLAQFTYNGSAASTYAWTFGDPASGANNSSTLQNPTHVYTNTGTYDITLIATNANGCTDSTTITATLSVTPALNYPALAPVCESTTGTISIATATVTNGVTGTGVYSGPGTDAAGNFNASVAGSGTHTITYTFTSTGNCISTTTSTITVGAKPASSFTFSPNTACLPTNGQVQFTYNGSVTGGETYLWNFNDPNANAGNPNTSTNQNPTHNYTNTGTYSVLLTVTGANGCTDDTTITQTFSVTPDLSFPALTAVCESAAPYSIATATVLNGVTGTGVYSGPGVNAAGLFNPATAGAGTHTITYTFTSTGNCVATRTQTINVNPRPVSSFTAPADICMDQVAQITSTSSIPGGTITTWNWNFGDNTTATLTNGNPFTHAYATHGNYNITLTTTSSNGCTSVQAQQQVAVHAMPVANFNQPAPVCMPNGSVIFTNTSTTPDNSSMTYQWNFGDPASGANNTSTLISPSHIYNTSSSYNITLVATSQFGCVSDTVKTFSAFFDKPLSFFVARPDTVCQGTPVSFTSSSSAPGSAIASYLWLFGDGQSSTGVSPNYNYRQPGTYTVKLVVTSTEGCKSDTAYKDVVVFTQPVIDAGRSFFVAQGTMIQFEATSGTTSGVTYLWTPSAGLSDATVLNPLLQANSDQTYTLTATANGRCNATDQLTVKVFKPVKITNAFSPNGDGINDTWVLDNVKDYPGVRVEVFNRYGQLVYSSIGYDTPWDGTMKGKPLPVAAYYYIIDLKNGFKAMNGSVSIIR